MVTMKKLKGEWLGADMKTLSLAGALLGVVLVHPVAHADLVNENLLAPLPAGYKVDFQERKGNVAISEMVPSGQSVQNWTEMVTVQIFFGMKSTPQQFRAQLEKRWAEACPDNRFGEIDKDVQNGYPTLIWLQACALNKATGKPEVTWFKALQGNDSFYLVQKASKFMPSQEQVTPWMQYFQRVTVCDSRIAARACPKIK